MRDSVIRSYFFKRINNHYKKTSDLFSKARLTTYKHFIGFILKIETQQLLYAKMEIFDAIDLTNSPPMLRSDNLRPPGAH